MRNINKNKAATIMNIFERLMFLAKGGRASYRHSKGKENINVTILQCLLYITCTIK